MKTTSASAIEVNKLTVAYEDKVALHDVNWRVKPGTLAAVIGPNGGGKSTLLKSLVGMIRSTSGSVRLFGQPPQKIRDQVAYLPQAEEVDWHFPITSFEVVLQGRLVHRKWWQRPSKLDQELALTCLERVKMTDLKKRPIGALSGGQKQRIFIARALAQQARLIIMDEPAAGLDAAAQHNLVELLEELRQEGQTVVVSTHDLNCLAEHFDTVLGLNQTVVVDGPPTTILNTDILTTLFARHFPVVKPTGEVAMHDY